MISDVRWNNILKMEERLLKVHDAINKLGETHSIHITNEYYKLKLKELRLTHEYQDKIYQEKQEQKRIQEQIREEERAQKEIEKALKESEDEERRYTKALEQAKKELEKAQGDQLQKIQLKMVELQKELEEAQRLKQRAISMAEQTKAGHVYVISNIGSFGESVYKIGMTRRLDPMDRVKELGDASVPFEFDVHAIIYSENAPEFEKLLHKEFDLRKVNLVNNRKEFFNITLDEIEEIAKKHRSDIEFTKIAEAREYRESIKIRSEREKL
ncbi:T5orf172 domain protein [Leptospira interrogans serovar Bataviae str. HAI135]|nr:T5orf172 domain protein [Leptospira interrogans serovar Bataviae str. HAI135]